MHLPKSFRALLILAVGTLVLRIAENCQPVAIMGQFIWLPTVGGLAQKQMLVKGSNTIMATGTGIKGVLDWVPEMITGPQKDENFVVVRDLNPVLYELRRQILDSAPWRHNTSLGVVRQKLAAAELAALEQIDDDIRRTVGGKTTIINIYDGRWRPEAKVATLTDRHIKRRRQYDRETRLPCGRKPVELAWDASLHPHFKNDQDTFYIEAPDEADRVVHYLLTHSFRSPRYPPLQHGIFATDAIEEALELITQIPPWRRILHTRDLDGPQHLTGHEVWFVLLTSWHGGLESATLTRDPDELRNVTGPYVDTWYAAEDAGSPTSTNPPPSSSPLARLAGGTTTMATTITARPRLAPLANASSLRAKVFNERTLCTLPTHDKTALDSVLLLLPGVDREPGFGALQSKRARVSALVGNDYVIGGVRGIGWALVRSGLLDPVLDMPDFEWYDPVRLHQALSSLLARMASSKSADRLWRKTGRSGTVAKIPDDQGRISPNKVAEIIEATKVIRGDQVDCVPADAHYGTNSRGALVFAFSPPLVRAERVRARGTDTRQPTHEYRRKPARGHVVPANTAAEQTVPTSATKTRTTMNNLQPRRAVAAPGEVEHEPARPSKLQVVPSDAGSDLLAMVEYGPEPSHWTKGQLEDRLERLRQEALAQDETNVALDDDDDSGEYFPDAADRPSKTSLNRLESLYVTITSPALTHGSVARLFSDRQATASGPISVPRPDNKPIGRSGAQQRAARVERITKNSPSKPLPSRRAEGSQRVANILEKHLPTGSRYNTAAAVLDAKAAAEAGVKPVAVDVGSIEDLLALIPLGLKIGDRFVFAAFAHLLEEELARNEGGMEGLVRMLFERIGAARCLARIATYGSQMAANGDFFPGMHSQARENEKLAATAAYEAGLLPPPRMLQDTFAQAYVHYQTALTAWPQTHVLGDLFELASFVMADLDANLGFALQHVFRRDHQNATISDSTREALASANADATAQWRVAAGDWLGLVLATTPYDPHRGRCGEAREGDKNLKTRVSPYAVRFSTEVSTKAAIRTAAGVGEAPDPSVNLPLPPFDMSDELKSKFHEIADQMASSITRDSVSKEKIAKSLRADLFKIASLLLCFRDRNVEIGTNLVNFTNQTALRGIDFHVLVQRGAPRLNRGKFSKALFPLAVRIRQMRGLSGHELIPYNDPTFEEAQIRDIIGASGRHYLEHIASDLEERCSRIASGLLPYVAESENRRVEMFDLFRRFFDVEVVEADGRATRLPWLAAEQRRPEAVKLRIKEEKLKRIESAFRILKLTFGTSQQAQACMTSHNAHCEYMNICFDRRRFSPTFIPTGHVRLSSTHVYFTGVDISRPTTAGMGAMMDITRDAGYNWAWMSQRPLSRLDVARYENDIRPVFQRRVIDNRVHFVPIVPIASANPGGMLQTRLAAERLSRRPMKQTDRVKTRKLNRQKFDARLRDCLPVDVRSELRTSGSSKEGTKGGLPRSWGNLKFQDQRDNYRSFLGDTPLDKQHVLTIDLGVRYPLGARISNPRKDATPDNPRDEACVYLSRGSLLQQQRRVSAEASNLNNYIGGQFDFTRDVGAGVDPLQDPVTVVGMHVLTNMHSEYERRQTRSKVDRRAEVQSIVSELVDLLVGGKAKWSPAELATHKFVIALGEVENLSAYSGVHGAITGAVIARQIPIEMRRRHLNFRICLVPEYMTSQHCPRPHCVDEHRRRSRTIHPKRENGSEELRLLHCLRCRTLWHRDGAGASNIMAMMMCLLMTDCQLWGERGVQRGTGR